MSKLYLGLVVVDGVVTENFVSEHATNVVKAMLIATDLFSINFVDDMSAIQYAMEMDQVEVDHNTGIRLVVQIAKQV